jgi:3-keto-L-gulonate-6-phosphate decarboxylase
MYIIYGLMETHTAADLLNEIDEEIVKIQTDLISEKDYQKLQNQFENMWTTTLMWRELLRI